MQLLRHHLRQNDRCRFIEHNLGALKSRFGVKTIDVAMPTHTNDDHYRGFPYLQRKYGTRVWCYESMVEILENPRGNRLGCILAEPIRVDRSFRHEETFRWEEFEFTITHNPGHAEHQMALFVTIDGKRVAFTGDNFMITSGNPTPDGSMRIRPVVLNQFVSDSYQKAIRTLIKHRPELIRCQGRPLRARPPLPMMPAVTRPLARSRRLPTHWPERSTAPRKHRPCIRETAGEKNVRNRSWEPSFDS